MNWIPLVVFLVIQVTGIVILIAWVRGRSLPFPMYGRPHEVFYLVRREDRAAYSRIMRRTVAVQARNMGRSFGVFQRTVAKQVLPAFQRFADAVSEAFGGDAKR